MRRVLVTFCLLLAGCPKSQPTTYLPPFEWPVDPAFTVEITLPGAETTYYEVVGRSDLEVLSQLRQLGPKLGTGAHSAVTVWSIRWEWPDSPTCQPVELKTSVQVTFPLWRPPGGAPSSSVGNWQRFVRALAEHEAQHVANANEAITALQTQMLSATCADISAIGNAVLTALRERDRALDEATQHGAAQGATLFVPRPDGLDP